VLSKQLVRLPEGVSFRAGAMVEPLSCCVHGADLAQVRQGDGVVVLGGGAIGLMLGQLAKNAGAAQVIVSEPVAAKRALALELGLDVAVDPGAEDLREVVAQRTGAGADVVVEAAGRAETAREALALCRPGGTVLWFGVCPEQDEVAVRPYEVFRREIRIQGVFINPFTATRARDIIAAGRVQVEPLVSHTFSLEQFGEGLEALQAAECVKAQVEFA